MQCFAVTWNKIRRRGFFDNFLVSALHRTVAFTQSNDIACSVAKNLHFDMACLLDIFFEKNTGIIEMRLRQKLHRFIGIGQLRFVPA